MKRMKADLENYDLNGMSTRTRNNLINSGWNTVLEAVTAFQENYTQAECHYLRIPGGGRKSLQNFIDWAGIKNTGDRSLPIVLTAKERAFIRDCLNTHHNKFHRNGPIREAAERLIEKFVD